MLFKPIHWSLSFVCLTIATVFSSEEYFYKIISPDDSFLDADIITFSNTRTRRFAEPLQQKNTSILTPIDNVHGLKQSTSRPDDLNFPSTITNETLLNHNITISKNDSHIYYNSTTINNKSVFDKYWVELTNHPNANIHKSLSDSHRAAATLSLKFQFPFYGHILNSTTIATGGFLYLGDYIHSWLATSQYIAPLMANFDLSTTNDTNIYYMDNGTAFTVTWNNVILQDKPDIGGFTFQTTLHSNGNIVFAYKNLPIKIQDIGPFNHPVKIGLSDAYTMDNVDYFMRRKTIYEYHRISFPKNDVTNGTVVLLTPLPTCLGRKNCTSCMKKDINFECYWCDNRCSSGVDRYHQEWHKKDCEKLKLNDKNICSAEVTPYAIGTPQPMDLDFPSTITNQTFLDHNITNSRNDSHIYYNSTTINNKSLFDKYWVELMDHPNANIHEMLSDSHRRAATISLKFQFPFYGLLINSTTITTGGFLYLGDYMHSWLAATQYVAPLMANFDLSSSNVSNIYYMDNDTAFTVTWQNVILQDKPDAGGFTFQTTLHSNGNIVFAYKNLPINLKEINATNHPVKIGLSDAYVMDKVIFFLRQKTIYEYHRISFHEDAVTNGTVIVLTALPTCMEKKSCTSCMKKDTNFDCYWCDNRCSSGVDRNRQEWNKKDCEKLKLYNKDICTSGEGTPALDNPSGTESVKSESHTDSSHSNTSLFFLTLFISLIIMSIVWVLYAYLNPHTESGQMLIRYRPTRWGWRKGEARYTAATIHM